MKSFIHVTILLLTMTMLGSCVKDDHEPSLEPVRVLLVYIGTDNNLAGFEVEKMNKLRDGWTGKDTDRLIAYVDNRNTGGMLYDLSVQGGESPKIIASYGKENSASPEVSARVISNVVAAYPADHYGLLVFSHASGWLPSGALENPTGSFASTSRSIFVDGSDEMSLADFAKTIPSGVFDYIAFETCFMAGIEVAYELKDKTPYLLVSSAEIVHPGFAPVYAESTNKLLAGNLQGFGQDVFDHTLTYASDNAQRSATYSVIRTGGIEALTAFVRDNCDFSRSVDVTQIQRFDRNSYHLFFDFGDYYDRLLDTDEQREELARLIENCVGWKAATDEFMTQTAGYNGFQIEKHSGLTTYIPQIQFAGLNAAYASTGWAQAAGIVYK